MKEALVLLTQDFVDRMRTHFNVVLEEEHNERHHHRGEQEQEEVVSSHDKVNLNNFIGSICEDEYFDEQMEVQVRESIDGEKETLEGLFNRILNDFKKPTISWLQFLGHFSKRGRLQGYNEIEVSPSKEKVQFLTMAEQGLSQVNAQKEQEIKEEKLKRLRQLMKDRLDKKEDLVPKEGKGKYNITVPVAFEFDSREKKITIRERKLQQMLKEVKAKNEVVKTVFRANQIPRSTREPKYQRILQASENRRQELKRMSIAITKQNEKPFSFYERDMQRAKSVGASEFQIPECMKVPPFKASIIPWRVRAPLY